MPKCFRVHSPDLFQPVLATVPFSDGMRPVSHCQPTFQASPMGPRHSPSPDPYPDWEVVRLLRPHVYFHLNTCKGLRMADSPDA